MSGTQLWLLASLAFASLTSPAEGAPPAEKQDTTTIMIPTHEDNCTLQRKGKISNDERGAKMCETTPTSQTDFVYKVTVDAFTRGFFTDIYTMRVLKVIKEGAHDVDSEGELRQFLSPPHCRMALDVQKGKTYLIMGTSRDILRNHQAHQYLLGERTWIEYWPTVAECQTEEHRPTCVDIEDIERKLTLFGCPRAEKQDTTTIMIPTHEDNCTLQIKGKISIDERTAKMCETTPTSQTDFVYKVTVDAFTRGFFTDIYTMRVLKVIKEGAHDVDSEGELRLFLSPPHCRMALDVQKGKTYLIMGTSRDILRNHQAHQYLLGERTWIEYWPTVAECQTEEHRPTCVGIKEMDTLFTLFGCQV